MRVKIESAGYTRVKDKINQICSVYPEPYCFPLYAANTPVWKSPTILVAYNSYPKFMCRLPFDYGRTLIMVESGGFTPNPPSTPEECLWRQMQIFPDITLTLDYPVKKGKGGSLPLKEKERRVYRTIKNAKRAIELKDWIRNQYGYEYEPMAVIQGYDIDSISRCTFAMKDLGYELYALGSITTESSSRDLNEIVRRVQEVREIIGEDAWLHVLGVMDVEVLLPIKEYITSFDASTASRLAIYGISINEDRSLSRVKLSENNFVSLTKIYDKYLWRLDPSKSINSKGMG